MNEQGARYSVWVCWKKPPAAFSPFFRAHVLPVRSARKNSCGLAGRTFLNRPEASDIPAVPGLCHLLISSLFNTPCMILSSPTGSCLAGPSSLHSWCWTLLGDILDISPSKLSTLRGMGAVVRTEIRKVTQAWCGLPLKNWDEEKVNKFRWKTNRLGGTGQIWIGEWDELAKVHKSIPNIILWRVFPEDLYVVPSKKNILT